MRYVLDTNIILFYLKNGKTRRFIDDNFRPFDDDNDPIVSIVTIAEIKAIGKKNNWGDRRTKTVENLFEKMVVVEITYGELIDIYSELDAYSQGKRFKQNDQKFSAKNMGKNDLWIAATAVLAKANLLTSDKDFQHLHQNYIDILTIENLD